MRRARIRVAGVPWHVTQRGHNRDACFFAPEDYAFYLNQLTRLSGMHGCAVHAYALMTNHIHLLLAPEGEDSVSVLMKTLAQFATQRCNKARDRSGALWEGRCGIVRGADLSLEALHLSAKSGRWPDGPQGRPESQADGPGRRSMSLLLIMFFFHRVS